MEVEFKVRRPHVDEYTCRVDFQPSQVSGEQKQHLHGDGLAIWLTKDRAQPGPVFGSIGVFPP